MRDKRRPPNLPYRLDENGLCVPDTRYKYDEDGHLRYRPGFKEIRHKGSAALKSLMPRGMAAKLKTKKFVEYVRENMGDDVLENIRFLAGLKDTDGVEMADKIRAASKFIDIALQPETSKTTKDVNVTLKLPSDDKFAAARFVRNVASDAAGREFVDAGEGAGDDQAGPALLPGQYLQGPVERAGDPEGSGTEREVADEVVDDGVQERE